MLTPTEGTIRVLGDSIAGQNPEDLAKLRRENIGFVFQSYHLFPTLSAADNVRLALDVRGETGKDATQRINRARRWTGSACPTRPEIIHGSSVAASSSGWRSRAPWWAIRR